MPSEQVVIQPGSTADRSLIEDRNGVPSRQSPADWAPCGRIVSHRESLLSKAQRGPSQFRFGGPCCRDPSGDGILERSLVRVDDPPF